MPASNREYIRLRDAFACAMNWLEDEEGNLPSEIPKESAEFLHKMLILSTNKADILVGETWTLTWPTEPGLYLFYGGHKDKPFRPRIQLCEVWNNKVRTRVASGQVLYESEQVGVFKPFIAESPDLEALGAIKS